MTKLRRFGLIFGALTLSLMAVSPALATDLNQDTPIVAGDYQGDPLTDCKDYDTEGMVLWHFILNQADAGQTNIVLTATFENADGDIITRTDTGEEQGQGQGGTYHFYVETPDGYDLTGASTAGDTENDSQENMLVLSHTCVGPPPPVIPEAPIALMLPLLALGVFGFFILRNRRQSTFGA